MCQVSRLGKQVIHAPAEPSALFGMVASYVAAERDIPDGALRLSRAETCEIVEAFDTVERWATGNFLALNCFASTDPVAVITFSEGDEQRQLAIAIEPDDSIADLKRAIQRAIGIPAGRQTLTSHGQPLRDQTVVWQIPREWQFSLTLAMPSARAVVLKAGTVEGSIAIDGNRETVADLAWKVAKAIGCEERDFKLVIPPEVLGEGAVGSLAIPEGITVLAVPEREMEMAFETSSGGVHLRMSANANVADAEAVFAAIASGERRRIFCDGRWLARRRAKLHEYGVGEGSVLRLAGFVDGARTQIGRMNHQPRKG
jgi:hypothetical protein